MTLPKLPPFRVLVHYSELIPRGYGASHRLINTPQIVCVWFGFHLFHQMAIGIYNRLLIGFFPTKLDRMLHNAERQGFTRGRTQGRIEGQGKAVAECMLSLTGHKDLIDDFR